MHDKKINQNDVDITSPELLSTLPERAALDRHSRDCRVCLKPVRGRRRNRYCSDKCRMHVYRDRRSARIRDLITAIETATTSLRVELEGRRGQ